MFEFLHFDIQSTGQKSPCVSIRREPSQGFVLIKQSDSPSPFQFWVVVCSRRRGAREWGCGVDSRGGTNGVAIARRPAFSPAKPHQTGPHSHAPHSNANHPRANLFPEVTDLICRLPLPTFVYRLEAVDLGDLMRLSVRPPVRITRPCALDFQGPSARRPIFFLAMGEDGKVENSAAPRTVSPFKMLPRCARAR